ncbi:hypothetical protein MJI37_31015, partial [Salmonella enterica subsp. enterica serovar Cerro]|nr:hypothetical protein [Salmonella enterica subsp. enterica serovar Cerro]
AITLMRHSLMGVADALAISRATLRNMKQNLLGAFIYNSIGIPASTKRLKGESRPVNPLEQRMIVLGALESVDWVVSFEEDTPQR